MENMDFDARMTGSAVLHSVGIFFICLGKSVLAAALTRPCVIVDAAELSFLSPGDSWSGQVVGYSEKVSWVHSKIKTSMQGTFWRNNISPISLHNPELPISVNINRDTRFFHLSRLNGSNETYGFRPNNAIFVYGDVKRSQDSITIEPTLPVSTIPIDAQSKIPASLLYAVGCIFCIGGCLLRSRVVKKQKIVEGAFTIVISKEKVENTVEKTVIRVDRTSPSRVNLLHVAKEYVDDRVSMTSYVMFDEDACELTYYIPLEKQDKVPAWRYNLVKYSTSIACGVLFFSILDLLFARGAEPN